MGHAGATHRGTGGPGPVTRSGPHRPASLAAVGCAVAVVAFVALVQVHPGGPLVTRNIDDLLQAAAPLLVALPLCLWRASVSTGRMRTYWELLAAAAAAWAAGQVVWCYLEIARHEQPTGSNWPTVGYLLAVVLIGAALILYPGPRLHWAGRIRALIDGLLIVSTLLFVSWAIAIDTGALQRSGAQLAERITVLTYPAADIVLLAMLLTVFSRGSRHLRDPLLVVGGSVLALFLGDSLSIYVGLADSYATGSVIDVCWFTAFLLLGLAALVPPPARGETSNEVTRPTWTEFVTYGPLSLALAIAVVQVVRGTGFDTVEVTLVLVSAALLMARGVLFVLENRVLMTRIESTVSELEWLTLHDPLTGLANRVLFDDRLAQVCAAQQRNPHTVALAYLDLDDFKVVNDSFGHEAGDELLRQVSRRLSANVRQQDTLARLSGDEFAILVQAVDGPSQVDEVLRRVLGPLDDPFVIDGRELQVRASTGYTMSFGVTDAKELLKQADDSMYVAKSEGKGRVHRYVDPVDHLVGFA